MAGIDVVEAAAAIAAVVIVIRQFTATAVA
jgi:hypothetical protein